MPQLRIELLGHVRILDGGEPVAALASARRRALLAYLAVHRHESIDRRRLAYLFWPDSEDAQARTNLRRELHHLRNELPGADDVVDVGSDALQWLGGGSAISDVAELEDALEAAAAARAKNARRAERDALERAAELYRGDLLPGFYDDWVEAERRRLRIDVLAALKRLVELAESAGDAVAAVGYAERITRVDPLDEDAYRSLMRLHQHSGNRAAAIHAYHRCASAFQRELDMAPSDATREVYETLLEAEGGSHTGEMVAETRDAAPFIGRESALARLQAAWLDARENGPRVVVVLGEAGMGKTRLVEEFVRKCLQRGASVVQGRAYAAEGGFSYGMAVDWLRSPAVAERVPELRPAWRMEIARLAPDLDGTTGALSEPADTVPASWHRRRLLEALARAVLAVPAPRLVIADDLQWADADSLDALHLLVHLDDATVLVVATVRTEELPGNAALERLLLSLRSEGRLHDVELAALQPDETARLARQVVGVDVQEEALARLQRVSEGVPLFVIETLRADEAGASQANGDGSPLQLPPRVHAVLAARLRQLSADARELAELAATIGRAFRFETLRQASDLAEETLVRALDELWRRRIILEKAAGAYDFSHDALRDAAYQTIDPARRRLFHRRVARALEREHAADTGPVSGPLAQHFEQGGETGQAVDAYRHAAREAVAVFSHEEALRLLDRALALLQHLPASKERDRRELELHLDRIAPARCLGGYTAPVVGEAAEHAIALAERLSDADALYRALRSLQSTRFVGARLTDAMELSRRLQVLAHDVPERRADGDHAMAGSLAMAGDLDGAITYFERAEAGYDPVLDRTAMSVIGSNLAVFTAAWHSHALWLAGLCDRAAMTSERAVRLADTLGHAYSRALANAYAAAFHFMRRNRRRCLTHARATIDICDKHGFAYYVHWGRLLAAWAELGPMTDPRVSRMTAAIAGMEAEGAAVRRPFYLSVQAMALARAGRDRDARAALAEAQARVEATEERWWTPELARLQGLLAPTEEARLACLRAAVARGLELRARPLAARAAVSLATSLAARGFRRDACAELGRVLDASPPRSGDRDRHRAERLLARLSS